MKLHSIILVSTAAAFLCGCVTAPMGPTVPVMPGPNKSAEAFDQDDQACQGFANSRIAGAVDAANNQAVGETLIGTALGAGIGAAAGGGRGAAIGAGVGTAVGGGVGSNTSANAQYSIQHRYNIAYAQCMSTKGDKVQWGPPRPPRYAYPPPPQGYYGPPPGGYPPPPGAYPPPPPPGQ